MSLPARRAAVEQLTGRGLSQRRACELAGLARSTLRYQPRRDPSEAELAMALQALAAAEPAAGYRRVWSRLRAAGRRVNRKRVHRLWQQLGLSQRPRRRRTKPPRAGAVPQAAQYPDHVWSYDFIEARTSAGRKLRILSVIDEFTRRCLALVVEYHQSAAKVVAVLDWLFTTRGRPELLRSDHGPEFIARAVTDWLAEAGCGTLYIAPGKPWQNAYIESFHGRLRAECLNQEEFADRREAEAVLEAWRTAYNEERPHSSLGWLSPEAYLRQCQDGRESPDPPIADGT